MVKESGNDTKKRRRQNAVNETQRDRAESLKTGVRIMVFVKPDGFPFESKQ